MRNDLIELLALLVSVGYDAGESGRKELPSGRKKR